MGSAMHYSYDLYHLYKKLVYDMMDAQTEQGLVPDIVPEYVVFQGPFRDAPMWGSASVNLPWLLYEWYGDMKVMKQAWPMMTKYVEYLKSKADGHILLHGLGDWLDLGPEQSQGFPDLTPVGLTSTAIYYYDVKLLSKMAKLIGKPDQAKKYGELATEIYRAFNNEFYNEEKGIYGTGSQTSMGMPLVIGLVDETDRQRVLQSLVASIRSNNNAQTSGEPGYGYALEALEQGGYRLKRTQLAPGLTF